MPTLPRMRSANEGGRIAIARDGNLFVTIGDRSQSPPWDMAQELDNHLGKMIRITPDGRPAPGNPFTGKPGALPEIWSYGRRSEEDLKIHPETVELWETELGPRGGDELITPEAGMEQAHYYWDPVIAPSGLAFYTGNVFPQWKNSVFVGALPGRMFDRLTLSGKKVIAEEPLLVEMHTRIRDVRMGREGTVYVLTDGGTLLKLTPK
jgi:glucose/arabinose dehydrogenase